MNVYGYDPKARLKQAHIVNSAVAYTVPETGQVVILSIKGNGNKGPQSPPSLAYAVLHEWCAF